MSARERIFAHLRSALNQPDLPFPPPETQALTRDERMAVTEAVGDAWSLARRFVNELEALHGSAQIVETPIEARLAAVGRLTAWVEEEQAQRRTEKPDLSTDMDVIAWDPGQLPLEALEESLSDSGFRLIVPTDLHDGAQREAIRPVRAGITGVDAAFASTGSVLLGGGIGKSRSASLTPFRHLILIPMSRLFPTIEAWMAEMRQRNELGHYLRQSANVSLISGPSKSADIEGNLTIGVHGPKVVHAILFDDLAASVGKR